MFLQRLLSSGYCSCPSAEAVKAHIIWLRKALNLTYSFNLHDMVHVRSHSNIVGQVVEYNTTTLQSTLRLWGVLLLEAFAGGTPIPSSRSFHSRDNSAGSLLAESLGKILTSLWKFTLEHQYQLHHNGMRNGRLLSYLLFNYEIIALSNILKKLKHGF